MLYSVLIVFIACLSNRMHLSSLRSESDVLAALWAEDVITLGEEAASHQRHGTLLTVEAVVVPLALLEGNVLAASETADGCGAGGTLLGIKVAEAVEAVSKVVS